MATTLTLNGIALDPSLIWSDRDAFSPVAQSTTRTIGGRMVVEPSGISKGRPITFVSERNQGWVDYATVLSLKGLAQVAGGTYALVVGSETFTVMFRHEEAPAFEATPLIKRLNPDPEDWFLVTIKLMTV